MIPPRIFCKNRIGLWIFITLYMGLMSCGQKQEAEQKTSDETNQNVAVNWTWKRTVSGDKNVIYGTIHNKGEQNIKQVELEFRTQNAQGQVLFSHHFTVDNVTSGEHKPFTQDYPARAAQEDSAFVTIKKVALAE